MYWDLRSASLFTCDVATHNFVSFIIFDEYLRPCLPIIADMVKDMKKIAEETDGLSTEERNLLSVAYKNVIGARRASWRVLSSLDKNNSDPPKAKIIKDYKEKVEEELKEICNEILQLLDNHLIDRAKDSEERVFYHKM